LERKSEDAALKGRRYGGWGKIGEKGKEQRAGLKSGAYTIGPMNNMGGSGIFRSFRHASGDPPQRGHDVSCPYTRRGEAEDGPD